MAASHMVDIIQHIVRYYIHKFCVVSTMQKTVCHALPTDNLLFETSQ